MSRGIIGSLANRTAESDAGVDNISLVERGDNIGVVRLLLLVKGRIHLANVMRRIRIFTLCKLSQEDQRLALIRALANIRALIDTSLKQQSH